MAVSRHTRTLSETHSRRDMLALAGGLAVATAAAATVAVQTAKATETKPTADDWRAAGFRSPMEHLVHRWWEAEKASHEGCEAAGHDNAAIDAILAATNVEQDAIWECMVRTPIRDLHDAGMVATIFFQLDLDDRDLAEHLRAGLIRLGFAAHK